MKPFIYIFAFLVLTGQAIAQLGDRFYGPGVFQGIQPSGDGGYFVAGTKGGPHTLAWLLKMDKNLNVIWEQAYNSPTGEMIRVQHFLIDTHGDLILSGTAERKAWAIKLDTNGQIKWNKIYSESGYIVFVRQKSNGGYYLAGDNSFRKSGVLLEIDNDGNLKNSIPVPSPTYTNVKYVEENPDNTLTVIGRTNGSGFEGIFFTKIKHDGTELFKKNYDTGYKEEAFGNDFRSLGVIKKANGNYLIANPYLYDSDCATLELNNEGILLALKQYGDDFHSERPFVLKKLKNEEIISCGEVFSNTGNYTFAVRLTLAGTEIWRRYYSQSLTNAILLDVAEAENGELVFCGMANDSLAYLLRTNAGGEKTNHTIHGIVKMDLNQNCISDAGDKVIQSVGIGNQNGNLYTISDENGNFILYTEDINNVLIAYPPDDHSVFCESSKTISIDSTTNNAFVEFLLKPLDLCPYLRVEITQPDLIRCQNSKYQVFVKNLGIETSASQLLHIQFDSRLQLQQYTPGGIVNSNVIDYQLDSLRFLEELVFEIVLQPACDVIVGTWHSVSAKLLPINCGTPWQGPKLKVDNECRDGAIHFFVKNIGASDMAKPAVYRIYAEQYLIEEDYIELKVNEEKEFAFIAKGKAFHFEIEDENLILEPGVNVSSTLEACGQNNNGFYSSSYTNAFQKDDGNDQYSISNAINSTGIPDRVQEMRSGLGYYHFIKKKEWMEFTLRTKNPFNKEIGNVEIQLSLTPNLDVKTFQMLGSSNKAEITSIDTVNLKINLTDCKLAPRNRGPDDNLYFKFRIKPFDSTPADSSERSFLSVNAKLFYDTDGPYFIRLSRNNLTNTLPYKAAPADLYPEAISLFGGRYIDFGIKVAEGKDGSVFLLSQTESYNDDFGDDGLIIKLDNQSKVIWYSVLPFRENHSEYVQSFVALPDRGCMITGLSVALGSGGSLINDEVMVARINDKGELVWNKFYKPGLGLRGGIPNDIIGTHDGNYLVCGVCSSGDNNETDNFLMKVDPDGNLIWSNDYVIDGLAFEALQVFELGNGDIICTGWDNGRSLLIAQKTDASGLKIWTKTVTPQLASGSYLPSSVLTNDGEILFLKLGYWMDQITGEYTGGLHFIKLSKDGNYVSEAINDIGTPEFITKDRDGNFLVVGEIGIDTIKFVNALLAKFDSNLNLLWYKDFGSSNYEEFNHVILDKFNFLHMIGYNQQMPPDYNLQTIYVKTDLNGEIVKNKDITDTQINDLLVFPNPAKDKIKVFFFNDLNITNTRWELVDLNGHAMRKGVLQSNKLSIAIQNIPDGLYALRFSNIEIPVQKIVIQH